jgi:hypothetical protein
MIKFAKNRHLDWIKNIKGQQFINDNPILKKIDEKNSINLDDYQAMYNIL